MKAERDTLLPERRPSNPINANLLYDAIIHGIGFATVGYTIASLTTDLPDFRKLGIALGVGLAGALVGSVRNVLTFEATKKYIEHRTAPEKATLIELSGEDGNSQKVVVVANRAGDKTTLLHSNYIPGLFNRADDRYLGKIRKNDADREFTECEAEKTYKDTAETIRSEHKDLLERINSELASKGNQI